MGCEVASTLGANEGGMELAMGTIPAMKYRPNKPMRIYDPEGFVSGLSEPGRWVVQPKWDGKRALIACGARGGIRMYSREGRFWARETADWGWLSRFGSPDVVDRLEPPWVLDGELLRDGRLFVWDFALLGGQVMWDEPYTVRLDELCRRIPETHTYTLDARGRFRAGGPQFSVVRSLPVEAWRDFDADPLLEGMVFKRLDATDFWGPWVTREVPSQVKYRIDG